MPWPAGCSGNVFVEEQGEPVTVPSVAEFLEQPLVAHVATAAPTLRPVWFLWEDGAFWWITGSYSKLPELLRRDPTVRLVVDTCDLASGNVFQLNAAGKATVEPKDNDRIYRKLCRYLGPDRDRWPERFRAVLDNPDIELVRLVPDRTLRVVDQGFEWPG